MLWLWAPRSDQAANWYDVPPDVCGEGALIELVEPMMTVRVKGVAWLVLPTESCSPDGFEVNESPTVFG